MSWWEIFLSGLIAGWVVEFALDYFFWRPRRLCPEAEQELRETVAILERELLRHRRHRPQEEEGQEEEEDEEPEVDDLEKIWGIGPKVEALLYLRGITTFAQLADTDATTLEKLLESGDGRFRISKYNVLESWQKQAKMAAAGQWPQLDAYQAEVARQRRQLIRNRRRER